MRETDTLAKYVRAAAAITAGEVFFSSLDSFIFYACLFALYVLCKRVARF